VHTKPLKCRVFHSKLQCESLCPPKLPPRKSFTSQLESVERSDPLIATSEIGVYNLLNFESIYFVNTDPDFDGNHLGLAPYTYPYVATFSPGAEIIDNLLAPNISTITASYIESTISSFTPKSFWYGCVLPFPTQLVRCQ
jgi:hypothetical protein